MIFENQQRSTVCARCGAPVAQGEKFCGSCGEVQASGAGRTAGTGPVGGIGSPVGSSGGPAVGPSATGPAVVGPMAAPPEGPSTQAPLPGPLTAYPPVSRPVPPPVPHMEPQPLSALEYGTDESAAAEAKRPEKAPAHTGATVRGGQREPAQLVPGNSRHAYVILLVALLVLAFLAIVAGLLFRLADGERFFAAVISWLAQPEGG